ncbi:MAG: VanZ family protein [Planctomycetota bacterium]|jgi:VanZ family protein
MTDRPPLLHRIHRFLVVGCAASWVAAFVLTHLPAKRLPPLGVKDTALHSVGYFVITSLFLLSIFARGTSRLRRAALVFGIMITYAAIDEITQPLVNRYAALADWLADAIGAAAAIVVWESFLAILDRRRRAAATPESNEP